MNVMLMCSACQDNMHVTVGAKCMLYSCQNKGSMHSACSRSNFGLNFLLLKILCLLEYAHIRVNTGPLIELSMAALNDTR